MQTNLCSHVWLFFMLVSVSSDSLEQSKGKIVRMAMCVMNAELRRIHRKVSSRVSVFMVSAASLFRGLDIIRLMDSASADTLLTARKTTNSMKSHWTVYMTAMAITHGTPFIPRTLVKP